MAKSKTAKCVYRERQANGLMANCHGTCDHGAENHHGGTCHHVLDIKKNGTVVYCKCVHHKGNHKSFNELGYLEPAKEDWMIPKTCARCKDTFTLHVDEIYCAGCIEINATEASLARLHVTA